MRKRGSAEKYYGPLDSFAFLWEHAIFEQPRNKNSLSDCYEILNISLRQWDHQTREKCLELVG